MKRFDDSRMAHGRHELDRGGVGAAASWAAPALCRFQFCDHAKSARRLAYSKTWWHFGQSLENIFFCCDRKFAVIGILLLTFGGNILYANPTGGTVTQGSAAISGLGSWQVTVNQTSPYAFINWQTFNIAAGETTTFNQPSATSITWNYINDPNASSINGNINANGLVVLQNPNGFSVGGSAAITAHGLIMTTASTPALNLSSSGPWSFNAPPPTAKIVNYGQINIAGGGPAFLIASDIENNGTISAPGGKIGLYAGQTVLVSTSPDGRSLSAQVTIPQGLVDNNGNLVANAGSIAVQAQMVNQNGVVQANSVEDVNGTIELVASSSVNLGAGSVILAHGDAQGDSSGGSVTIQSGNSFSDQAGSTINISGGAQGGNGGQVEISAPQMSTLNSSVNGQAVNGFISGVLSVDPLNILLAASSSDPNAQYSGTVNPGDPPASGTLTLNVNSFASTLSQINLQAQNNIELSTVWTLTGQPAPATLSLSAGNNITLDNGAAITAGNNWTINLTAGTQVTSQSQVTPGNGGIYLNGSAYIQAVNGNAKDPNLNTINLYAANEVIVNGGAIRTIGGGNINVTAEYGNVNCGNNVNGFTFGLTKAPYYTVNSANLGGISTAAGGNVTITAGGNVASFLPTQNDYLDADHDAGTGAFGSQPGNVTVTAGGNVSGHYVLANGQGTITAGGNIGAPVSDSNLQDDFALSLINGGWSIYAQGNIYVQDVRNPSGVFGERPGFSTGYAGYHHFNYSPFASLLLDAVGSVEITGNNAPNSPPSAAGLASIPLLVPPVFQVITGPGGNFILDTSVTLFPSPYQNLSLSIGGDFIGKPSGNPINLEMSDSAATSWPDDTTTFGITDHAATPPEVNNANVATISVAGNIEEVNIYADEQAQITVGKNMVNSGFSGENLHPSDVTSINVAGSIVNSPLYTFESLSTPIASANPLQLGVWDSVFDLAVNPDMVSTLTSLDVNNTALIGPNGLAYYLNQHGYLLFPYGLNSQNQYGLNPGFIYDSDPTSLQLGFKGNMSSLLTPSQIAALEGGTFTVLVADSSGNPIIGPGGHLEVMTYTFSAASAISGLLAQSQNATTHTDINPGLQIGGPGQFNVSAGSMDLGYSQGIISYGFEGNASLEGVSGALASGGAAVNVQVAGDINMITSSIASIDGGNVTVNAGGQITASQGTFNFQTPNCYGIYTTGHSDVSVTANGDINVGSGCIGAFDGGNVFVESYDGDVNAGTGVNKALNVQIAYFNPATGLPIFGDYGSLSTPASLIADPAPYGSGILAEYPTQKYQTPGGNGQPGNITVLTPHGNIVSAQAGIAQFALDQSTAGGTTVTLVAGTPGVAATPDQGNIILGLGGIIGGTINVTAQGQVQGLIVSRQNANINAVQSFSGIVLAGGTANFGGGGTISGTVVGIGGINTGGSSLANATLLSQNISGANGSSYSSLATSASTTAASQSAAQQANQAATQQVASTDNGNDDDKKKKKAALSRSVGRVTVILPKAS